MPCSRIRPLDQDRQECLSHELLAVPLAHEAQKEQSGHQHDDRHPKMNIGEYTAEAAGSYASAVLVNAFQVSVPIMPE